MNLSPAAPRRFARAFIIIGMLSVLTAACTSDPDPTADSSMAITTTTVVVDTTVPVTDAASTTIETTLPPTTLESTTTTEPPPVGWTAVESLPSLAYLPCCASNWSGERSPAIPADASVGLAPGIYYAHRIVGDVSTDDISFEVSRFEACTELPEGACEDGPYVETDMGIEAPTRGFTLPLDKTIRVGVSGSDCEPDQQLATADLLQVLMDEFDDSYEQLLGDPFEQGEPTEALTQALIDVPTGGFSGPQCDSGDGLPGTLVWRGADGPPILLSPPFAYDDDSDELVAPPTASAEWLRLTAIEIAADGSPTLYFYAGFYS